MGIQLMTPLKLIVLIAFGIVVFKFVASAFGRSIPLLNPLVTAILSVFVAYELIILGRVLVEKFV